MPSKDRVKRKRKQDWHKQKSEGNIEIADFNRDQVFSTDQPANVDPQIDIQTSSHSIGRLSWYATKRRTICRKLRAQYKNNPGPKIAKVAEQYRQNPQEKRMKVVKLYKKNPGKKLARDAERYKQNPDKKRVQVSESYKANPGKKRAREALRNKKNPEKKRAREAQRNKKNPEKKRAREAQRNKKNPEKKRAREAQRNKTNPEKKRAREAQRNEKNPEKKRAREAQRNKKNPEKKRAREAQRNKTNPEKKRTREAERYRQNPDPKIRQALTRYYNSGELHQHESRRYHQTNRLTRLEYFRRKYDLVRSRRRMTEQRRSQMRRKTKRRNILKLNMNQEQLARDIAKKLSGRSFPLRLVKSKGIVKWVVYAHKVTTMNFRKHHNALQTYCKSLLERMDTPDQGIHPSIALCGKSLHTNYTEPYLWEMCYNLHPHDKPIVVNPHLDGAEVFPEFASINTKHGTTRYRWTCSDVLCKIDPTKNFSILQPLLTNLSIASHKSMVESIFKVANKTCETNKNSTNHSLKCYYGSCSATLLFLKTLGPHYPDIRKLISKLYAVLKDAKYLLNISSAVNSVNLRYLMQLEEYASKSSKTFLFSNKSSGRTDQSEAHILEEYAAAFHDLEARSCDTPTLCCVSCEKLYSKRQVVALKNIRKPLTSNVWNRLKEVQGSNIADGYLCLSCREKIGKNLLPATCILNGLLTKPQPLVLKCLNSYEKIIIQRAKAFQVVTKMQPVGNKRLRAAQQINKVVGRSFHLPLPLEQTLKRLPLPTDPINLNTELYVMVRGVPTKQKQVWQSIVDVTKLYSALKYLKINNPLYAEIILPEEPQELLPSDQDVFELPCDGDITTTLDPPLQRRAMLTQVTAEDWEADETHYTIHALHEAKTFKDSTELYQMLKINEAPLDHQSKNIDLLCFPDLFPEGQFGQFHPGRTTKLTSAEFIKSRLLSKHPQFRLNQQYLFYLLHDANFRQLQQGIFHKLNVTGFKTALTAGSCLASIASGDLEGNLTSIFAKLRNTSQYWVQPRNDVNCMAHHYGPATWFLTLSPSEWNWDDLALYIKQVDATVPGIETKSTSELVALDPVSSSRFIHLKFMAMLDFIVSDAAPLGKVTHYFYRREYQSRGLQHFHTLLWVKDAPVIGSSTQEDVAKFILKYASCSLPDTTTSPTLYYRVTNYQTHHHNSYCLRNKKTKLGFCKVCRFGFPRPVTDDLVVRDIVESVAGRKSLRSNSRLYDLPRTPQERTINDYNPAVLLAWNGNVDLQFVGEKTALLHWYVTKYTTKSEQTHINEVFDEMNSTKSLVSRLYNVGLRALNNRECGSLEAADTLLGIPLYGTDPDTTIKWLDVAMIRKKRLQNMNKLQTLDKDSTDIFYESWVDDHYPNRPDELDEMCLYDLVRWFNLCTSMLKSDNRETYKLPNGKFLIRRTTPCLINHYKYSPQQDPEKYYYALLLMFLPWRSTDELKGDCDTYAESFIREKDSLQLASEYADRLQTLVDQANEARAKIQARVEEIEAEDMGEVAADPDDPENIAFEPHAIPEVLNYQDPANIEPQFEELHARLNADQLRVFEFVKARLTSTSDNARPLSHFVSGVGGTGKSFLIKTFSQWTKEILSAPTSISAPTGLSAYNVNGFTIYRVFQLPVEHGKTPRFRPLADEMLKQLRFELKDVVLFIIDEISMVSNLTLMYINLRLCEIFNTVDEENGWFGKKHLLMFGDLLQLPPVHEESPFVKLGAHRLQTSIGALSSINIWAELFTYDELTINMRQAEDTEYAELLSRVRLGQITVRDVAFLLQKRIPLNGASVQEKVGNVAEYLSSLPSDTVCLCSTTNQCARLNEEMMTRLPGLPITLLAKDSFDCDPRKRTKAEKFLSTHDDDCSRTAGMDKKIVVKLGARIMLRRNIDVTIGLVNSAIGTITKVNFDLDTPTEVSSLEIHFQNGTIRTLERVTAKFELFDKAFVYRQQFPITTSYAVTIHKCQGLSLKTVLMDIGEAVFTVGQSYVALSRVTSSRGLHLINFNPREVKAQKEALIEYNRLRTEYRRDLPLIDCSATDSPAVPYIKDRVWCVHRSIGQIQERVNDPQATKDAPPSRSRVQPQTLNLRGLLNPNIACYANSAVQMLYSQLTFREIIRSSDVSPAWRDHLSDYECSNVTQLDTWRIREIPPDGQFLENRQQDCQEFLTYLLAENIPLRAPLTFVVSVTRVCMSCNLSVCAEEEPDIMARLPVTIKKGLLTNFFDAIFNTWQQLPGYSCSNCHLLDTTREKRVIVRSSQYVLVQLLAFNNNMTKIRDTRITGVPNSRVLIAGCNYKPVAAIFHHGETLTSGHYTCYIRSGTGWMCANDSNISRQRWPLNAADMYMLLLERC